MEGWLTLEWQRGYRCSVSVNLVPAAALLVLAAFCIWRYCRSLSRVYLLDFACYRPPQSLQVNLDMFLWGSGTFLGAGGLTQESVDFQHKISERNGLGYQTYAPPALHRDPIENNLTSAMEEAKMVLFGAVEEVLARTGVQPKEIDFLVINCSLFNPTPSLSALVVNQFKLRSDIVSYNLSGMGCSAGIISVDAASRLLQLTPNRYALVISTENMTQNWYTGNVRSMLIPNTLFRMGCAAVLMTNKRRERRRAKYELLHVVRVHLGADDKAYRCVYQKEDGGGKVGVELNKDIIKVAAAALQRNLTILGPLVLPVSEQAKYAWDLAMRRLGSRRGKAYVPDFRKAFDHFCLHAGGRSVVEGLGSQLRLAQRQLEPSFSSLFWYGNTSSASYWYGFAYAEAKHGIKKGDKVWQVGFGSGFKSNSAVWRALRPLKDDRHKAWAGITEQDTARMWRELEAMGVRFNEDGVLPANGADKKPQTQGVARNQG